MVSAMKTRKPDTPKSTTTKKPAPAKTPTEPVTENQAPAAPKPTVTKPAPAIKAKQVKTKATTAPSLGSPQPAVEEAKASPDVVKVTPEKKAIPRTRIVKKIVKKIVVRKKVPTSTKAVANKSPPMLVTKLANVEESSKKEEIEDAKDVEFVNKEESTLVSAKESVKKEETNVQNTEGFTMEDHNVENVEEPTTKEEVTGDAQPLVENVEEPTKKNEVPVDAQPSVENVEEQTKKKEVAGDVKRLDENVEELTKKNEVAVDAQPLVENVEEPTKKKKVAGDVQPLVENVEELTKKEEVASDVRLSVESVEELTKKEEVAGDAQTLAETVLLCSKKEVPALTDSVKSSANQETSIEKAEEEETNMIEDKVELNQPVNMDKNTNEESKGDDVPPWEQVDINDEKMERRDDKESHEEFGEEDLVEDNVVEHGEESAELKEENAELTAPAKECKIKKELEIFVGGLDRDAVEDDVKKVFDNVGEVVEVRLQKNPSSNKNKGYAFVRFATKEQATRALAEIKNPVIHGKRCRTSLSEDNDTLFLGNICNTWTKEAIKQKLKDYGIECVENIDLVEDPQHEGLSRGFALVEFSCHAEAMLAYKRLQKPDVIFGHSDRTAKVAFAEPLPEPDPAVMALVKSVFVDGLPPHWDEDRVRKEFKCYGDLDRITLARNMSNAKRKDFGFVDFSTHEAAVACIDDINTRGLGDGKFKTRVRARLSNPLPKTQIVKGGMCGGFRIGHPSGRTFSKFGKGFRRGGHPDFGVQDFQHDWDFYQHGSAQTCRMGFIDERDFDSPYPPTHGIESFQGRRWGPTVPARHALDRFKHGDTDRGPGRHMPWRGQPVFPEEEFNRPFLGRQFDDPYRYDGSAHGIKRRNFTGKHSDYVEPSRVRTRYDYSDPAFSLRGTRYRDTFGDGSSLYSHSHDYYGSDYPRGSDSSFYGGDHPYGGRYYQ